MDLVNRMGKSPNGRAITPFLQWLPAISRKLTSSEQLSDFLAITLDLMERTTGSIHGIHQTFPSPGLPDFFKQDAGPAWAAFPEGIEKLGGLWGALLP